MRMKKTCNTRFSYKLDKIFWFFISFLPITSWLVYLLSYPLLDVNPSSSFIRLANWISSQFLSTSFSNNIVFQTFIKIFGPAGEFPLLDSNSAIVFFWLVSVELIHVMFDVVVFIPRLAHKWISKAVQDD